jgi:hypothetical protein
MKPGNLTRHVLTHLGVRWICENCEGSLSREDAFRRHALEKPNCQNAKAVIKYGDGSVTIDTAYLYGGWSATQNVMCIPWSNFDWCSPAVLPAVVSLSSSVPTYIYIPIASVRHQ